jgi:hypothetical protein
MSCFFFRLACIVRNSVFDLVCDTSASRTRAEHDEASIIPLRPAYLESGHYRRQGHAASSLNVVVEARDLRRVLVEDSARVVQAEIFKVDVCFGVALSAS